MTTKYTDLETFCAAHPFLKKQYIASRLSMTPQRFSKVKSGKLSATDEEIEAIADLLNQSISHTRSLYQRAA
jgi:hypothetical protein